MDKDKEREDLRDLKPEKDAKGGLHAKDLGEKDKKPIFQPAPPVYPPADTDPYSKT